jgi:hypothetical protein
MIIGYSLVSLVWLLNTIIGNKGGVFHMIFLRTSQATALLVILELLFGLIVSYGTQAES